MADLYDIDISLQTENLLNPLHRDQVNLDFIGCIAANLQKLRDDLFGDFKKGASYSDYSSGTNYALYDRIVWTNFSVYELQVNSSIGIDPTGQSLSVTNWRLIQDVFIGTNDLQSYSGQLIVFEYAINKYFRVNAPPYIYCDPISFGGTQTFVQINVPTAVYLALGPNNTARTNRVKKFATAYTLAGTTPVVAPY